MATWTNQATTGPDLTHISEVGTFAAAPLVYTTYDPVDLTVINGSTVLLSVLPDVGVGIDGITLTSLLVEHLDPSGNTIHTNNYPGVWASTLDGPSVVKMAAYASALRVTVGVSSVANMAAEFATFTEMPSGAVVQAYSSPTPMVQSARGIHSHRKIDDFPDSILWSAQSLIPPGTSTFTLRFYAGLVVANLDFDLPATDFEAGVVYRNADGAGIAGVKFETGETSFAGPAALGQLVVDNMAVGDLTITGQISARNYTL